MTRADRPFMPGYGLVAETEGEGLLPWSWAEERLAATRDYWISTVRPDGRPHAMPVWGVYVAGRVAFSTGRKSRKFRNLDQDPRCVITNEDARGAVIVEGRAQALNADVLAEFVEAYKAKYDVDPTSMDEPILEVVPDVAFGLIDDADRFGATATRWTFDR